MPPLLAIVSMMPRASAHARGGTDFGRVGLILAGPPDHILPRIKFFVTGLVLTSHKGGPGELLMTWILPAWSLYLILRKPDVTT